MLTRPKFLLDFGLPAAVYKGYILRKNSEKKTQGEMFRIVEIRSIWKQITGASFTRFAA
jgi:hypothetical protein